MYILSQALYPSLPPTPPCFSPSSSSRFGGYPAAGIECDRWGLVPSFTKKGEKPNFFRMFNARSETASRIMLHGHSKYHYHYRHHDHHCHTTTSANSTTTPSTGVSTTSVCTLMSVSSRIHQPSSFLLVAQLFSFLFMQALAPLSFVVLLRV